MNLQTALTDGQSVTLGWIGGRGFLYAIGTWAGGSLTATWSPTYGGTFVSIQTGVSLSANGTVGFEIGQGWIKLTNAGATTVTAGVNITTVTQH